MSESNCLLQNLFCGIIVSCLAFSCGQSTQSQEGVETGEPSAFSESYTVTPFGPSQAYPDAKLESMDYKDGRFTFAISGETYKLGVQTPDAPTRGCANSAEGQHIHLIVDSLPYAAKYVNSFEYDVADGTHYILAFLSRSYHESLKSREAAIAVQAVVENKSFKEVKPIATPMLFYSRPKGTYDGADTEKVMLDYYLINPATTYRVKATINGVDHFLDTWQPYTVEGLAAGESEIKLTLVDTAGQIVNAPLNQVTRKFILNPNPPQN
jgi:hypothetical protein